MQNIKDLEFNIEIMREKLNKLIVEKNFKLENRDIIKLSQELDILLENYVKLEKNILPS